MALSLAISSKQICALTHSCSTLTASLERPPARFPAEGEGTHLPGGLDQRRIWAGRHLATDETTDPSFPGVQRVRGFWPWCPGPTGQQPRTDCACLARVRVVHSVERDAQLPEGHACNAADHKVRALSFWRSAPSSIARSTLKQRKCTVVVSSRHRVAPPQRKAGSGRRRVE
jgi:hypothetical protein